MRHDLTTRFIVILSAVLLAVAALFAIASNVETAPPVDPEEADEVAEDDEASALA